MVVENNRSINTTLEKDTNKRPTRFIFDQSKSEKFTIQLGFRQLQRRLKNTWNVDINTDEITKETFNDCRVFIVPNPKKKFAQDELDSLRWYLESGGSIILLVSEDDKINTSTNVNLFLQETGIQCNQDAVIRTVFHKYFEPKEALIFDGILNRAIGQAAGIAVNNSDSNVNNNLQALTLLYPFGCTLTVDKRSIAVLSTGSACYPICRPICAFHKTKNKNGKLVVVGSVHMFTDAYIDKEKNFKIWDVITKFVTEDIEMNELDSNDPDITDEHCIPNHIQLSEQVKVCLQECDFDTGESSNFMNLFDTSLYSIDLSKWAKAIKILGQWLNVTMYYRTYEEVGLDHEPLSLIVPQFQVPLPPLEPAYLPNLLITAIKNDDLAVYYGKVQVRITVTYCNSKKTQFPLVLPRFKISACSSDILRQCNNLEVILQVFPPEFGELAPPKLELFDLDEMFASTETRLARLANKCSENDCEYFLKEAAEILGITRNLPPDDRGPRRILEYVLLQVAEFKKLNQEDDVDQNLTDDELQTFQVGLVHENELSDIDESDELP